MAIKRICVFLGGLAGLDDQYLASAKQFGKQLALNNIGLVYQGQGRYDEALDFYNQALEIWREVGHRAGETP